MVKRPEQERIRIEKISYLEEKGVKPFGHRYDRTHNAETIVAEFDKYSKEELKFQLKNKLYQKGYDQEKINNLIDINFTYFRKEK